VVVDLNRVLAGPFCTMMLAELGARVIKVENPEGGDDSRHFEPFFQGQSAYFVSLNRGKESIALDLKAAADKAVFRKLVGRADVLVENFRPGTLERLDLGYESLREINPRLIYAAANLPFSKAPSCAMPPPARCRGPWAIVTHPSRPLSRMPRRTDRSSSRPATTRFLAGWARLWAEPTSPPIGQSVQKAGRITSSSPLPSAVCPFDPRRTDLSQ
jgi:hypothetical protein